MSCRKRSAARITTLAAATVLLGSAAARDVPAQPALERLEQQIRKQLQQDQGKPAAEQPAAKPRREPGYLGLVADDQKDRGRGVRVLEVRPGGPAEKAGLKPGDLVTGLAGMRLRQMSEMMVILRQVPAGGSVLFEVLRDGEKKRIEVVAGQRPTEELPQARPLPQAEAKPAGAPGAKTLIPVPPPPGPKQPAVEPAPQAGPPPDDHARIEQLQRRVEALEKRVRELEALLRQQPKREQGE